MKLATTTQLLLATAFLTAALCGPFPPAISLVFGLIVISAHFLEFRLPLGARGELLIWLPGVLVMLWGVFNPFAEGIGHEKTSGAALSSAATMLLAYGFFLALALSWSTVKERLLKQVAVAIGMMVVLGRVPYTRNYALCGLLFGALVMVLLIQRRQETMAKKLLRKGRSLNFWAVLHAFVALGTGMLMALSLPAVEQYAVETMISATSGRKSGFAAVTNLNSVGKMQKSRVIVLRVKSKFPPPYLRGMAYNYYRAGRWRSTCSAAIQQGSLAPQRVPAMKIVSGAGKQGGKRRSVALRSASVFNDNPTIGLLFVPLSTVKIEGPEIPIKWDSHLGARVPFALGWTYETGPNPVVKPGATAPSDLLINKGFTPRMKELALTLTKGAKTEREKVERICGHFASFKYSLEKEKSPKGMDPVEDFVFRTQQGHCELYATATVILLRYLDIPARYITGFSIHEKNPLTDLWLARERDAHAWVEVLLPGEGWVTIDTTPGSGAGGTPVLGRWIDYVVGWFRHLMRRLLAWWEAMNVTTILRQLADRIIILFKKEGHYLGWLLLLLLFLGPTIYRRLRHYLFHVGWLARKKERVEAPNRQHAHELLSKLEEVFSERGLDRAPFETLAEFIKRALTSEEATEEQRRCCHDIVATFERTMYRGDELSLADVTRLSEELTALFPIYKV